MVYGELMLIEQLEAENAELKAENELLEAERETLQAMMKFICGVADAEKTGNTALSR